MDEYYTVGVMIERRVLAKSSVEAGDALTGPIREALEGARITEIHVRRDKDQSPTPEKR